MTLREFLEYTRHPCQRRECLACNETLFDVELLAGNHVWSDGDGNRHLPPETSEYDRGWNEAIDAVRKYQGYKFPIEEMKRKPSCRKEPI